MELKSPDVEPERKRCGGRALWQPGIRLEVGETGRRRGREGKEVPFREGFGTPGYLLRRHGKGNSGMERSPGL